MENNDNILLNELEKYDEDLDDSLVYGMNSSTLNIETLSISTDGDVLDVTPYLSSISGGKEQIKSPIRPLELEFSTK